MTQKIYEYFEGTARYTKALSVTEDSGQKTDGVTDNPSTREKEKKEMLNMVQSSPPPGQKKDKMCDCTVAGQSF